MTISRRQAMLGAGFVSAAVAANSVSACSPPMNFDGLTVPGEFFAKVTQGRLLDAQELLAADVTLSLATTAGSNRFEGPNDVAEAAHKLISVEGFSMIGDTEEVTAGGMYWRHMGPWQCSDMLKGGAVEFASCEDGLFSDVLNVLVHRDGDPIKTILIYENMNLILHAEDGLARSRDFGS